MKAFGSSHPSLLVKNMQPEGKLCDAAMNDKEIIIIFVKWPEKGMVKSRLAAALDDGTAAELYRCFVEDLISTVKQTGRRPCIAFYPADAEQKVISWLGDDNNYMTQQGNDIGEKMRNAFLSAFSDGMERVVLIGSDFPDLPSQIIEEAFSSLNDSDAVIGPARDGGYYLIGFKRDKLLSPVFKDISWSTPQVFEETVVVFNANGYKLHELPYWSDIDRREDLSDLISRNRETGFAQSRTMKLLHQRRIFS